MSILGDVRLKVMLRDLDITEFVESVNWSGSLTDPYRTLSIQLMNTVDGRNSFLTFSNGDTIQFGVDGKRVFIGTLFAFAKDTTGKVSLTCYDRNIYLMKSHAIRSFKNKKASDIIKSIAKDFNIPVGDIEDTGYVIPALILRNNSLYDMINKALTLSQNQNGKRFWLSSVEGKLTLKQHQNNVNPWVIRVGENLTSANYSLSIEDTKNAVQVTGGKDKKLVHSVKNSNSQKQFGVMQHVEEMDEKATLSQVKQRADSLLKELNVINDDASISSIGIVEAVKGSGIYVYEPMTGLVGGYYISADSHDFVDGMHTMNLEISKSLEMPDVEITDEELGIVQKKVKKVAKK